MDVSVIFCCHSDYNGLRLWEGHAMPSPVAGRSVSGVLAEFRDKPELSSLAAELLWQAVAALRSAIHRAADTDLADLIAADSPTGGEAAASAIPGGEGGTAGQTLADATVRFQVEHIRHTIEQSDGNMSRAADRLGLNRSNLYRRCGNWGWFCRSPAVGRGAISAAETNDLCYWPIRRVGRGAPCEAWSRAPPQNVMITANGGVSLLDPPYHSCTTQTRNGDGRLQWMPIDIELDVLAIHEPKALLAQLVERLTLNQKVEGSSPSGGTTKAFHSNEL